MVRDADVRSALDRVVDPELDRSVTSLDFVRDVEVAGAAVTVRLRLPTYWCAPNFAWMMVSDAHDAVAALPGVQRTTVELVEHFAAEQVSAGVQAGLSFQAAFPDQADGGLDELRRRFRRKAFLVRQEPVLRAARRELGEAGACARLLAQGPPGGVEGQAWEEYLRRRAELGMDAGAGALAFTDVEGRPLCPDDLTDYLRLSRSARVSLEANTEFCTGLLAARYGEGLEAWQGKEVAA